MNESPNENPYLTLEGFCRLRIEGDNLEASINQGGYDYVALPNMESGSGLSYLLHMVTEHMPQRYIGEDERGGNLTVPTFELDILFAKPDSFKPMILVWKKIILEILTRMKRGVVTTYKDIGEFIQTGLTKEWTMLEKNPDPSFTEEYNGNLLKLRQGISNVMTDMLITSTLFKNVPGMSDKRAQAFLLGNLVYLSIRDPSLFSNQEMEVL